MIKTSFIAALIAGVLALTFAVTGSGMDESPASTDDTTVSDGRVYEMRTYTTHEGRLGDLHERFENHTLQLFAKHGMVNVGYWVPEAEDHTLIYILSHRSREAAEKSWEAFRQDPEWQAAYEASRRDGPIVSRVESVFMTAAPYSQIR